MVARDEHEQEQEYEHEQEHEYEHTAVHVEWHLYIVRLDHDVRYTTRLLYDAMERQ